MKLKVRDLIKDLGYTIYNEKNADLDKEIASTSVHRSGLELAGLHKSSSYHETIVGWGTKECKYLQKLTNADAKKAISNVLTDKTPLLILSEGFTNKKVFELTLKIANENKIPVVNVKEHLSPITAQIAWYLIEHKAQEQVTSLHASLAIINGVGVMIIGPSGIGKSEALLELIHNGHIFVSDDTVDAYRIGSSIYGQPAKLTEGLLEARGIGLINIPFIYGARSVKKNTDIELVVELLKDDKLNEVDRLGNKDLKYNILQTQLPKIQIPIASGRSIAALIEAATNVFLARKQGMDPLKMIADRNRGE